MMHHPYLFCFIPYTCEQLLFNIEKPPDYECQIFLTIIDFYILLIVRFPYYII